MLMGATGVFAQLQAAMNDVWEVQPDPNRGQYQAFLRQATVFVIHGSDYHAAIVGNLGCQCIAAHL